MDPVATPRDEWKTLPWRALERAVFKLQKRIFRAAQQDGPGRLRPSTAGAGFDDTDRPSRSRVRGNSHARCAP